MSRPKRNVLSSRNLTIMGVPKKMHDLCIEDFDTYDEEDLLTVRNFISEYLDNISDKFENNQGLFMYGSNGVGKTFLASMIVIEAYRCRYSARRVTFSEYISRYTSMWGAKTPEEKELLEDVFYNSYKAVEFLVLEEVGKELDTKLGAPVLEDLLRYREDNSLVTVICANLPPSEIKDRYGASVSSLLKGNMTPILIEGRDKRQEYYKDRTEEC